MVLSVTLLSGIDLIFLSTGNVFRYLVVVQSIKENKLTNLVLNSLDFTLCGYILGFVCTGCQTTELA